MFVEAGMHLKCLPPKLSMNSVRPLLVTESVTMVVPGYFLYRHYDLSILCEAL